MTDRYRAKISEEYNRGMVRIPVNVDTPEELRDLMCLACWINPRMTTRQKLHTISNILTYNLAKVTWETKEYQQARMEYIIRDTFAGVPADLKRSVMNISKEAMVANRFTSLLESFLMERPIDQTLSDLSKQLDYPKGFLELEFEILTRSGLIEKIEDRARLTDIGMKELVNMVTAK